VQNMVLQLTGGYKEGFSRDEEYERRILWLRSLMEWRQDVEDAREFVEGMKSDVFEDRVYVFTPRVTSLIFRLDLHQSILLIMYIRMSGIVAGGRKSMVSSSPWTIH